MGDKSKIDKELIRELALLLKETDLSEIEIEEDGYVLVEVPCGEGDTRDCHELIVDIESWLSERGLPFVPEEIDGRVVIRPPAT
jgi:hypothetical protein